ncbi:MAG: hypothetical protein ABIG29_00080 [Candidatus Nealsonbacteria bacterium]
MKITICGSIAFYKEMEETKAQLEKLGHEVKLPPSRFNNGSGQPISASQYYEIRKTSLDNEGWVWDTKEMAMRMHFDKVDWSDAILVLNYAKNNVPGYIGGNTLMEAGIALFLNKKIYLLNSIPEISYKEEILGMKPVVINGDLSRII